jgi:hypothetical protein
MRAIVVAAVTGVGVGISVGIVGGIWFVAAPGEALHKVGLAIALCVPSSVAFGIAFSVGFGSASDAALARKKTVFDKPPRYPLGL